MRGPRITYSEEELDWIKAHATQSRREIAGLFALRFKRTDVTEDHIKGLCSRKGWSAGPAGKRRNTGVSLVFTSAQVQWLKDHATLSRRECYQRFIEAFPEASVSMAQIVSYRKRAGIKTGRTGRFTKGQVSWNKGKSVAPHPNSVATHFKKGHRPHNDKGVGHEMVCPKDGYVYLIVGERNPHTGAATRRVLKHKWVWERAHGPLPDDHCLKCVDGDRTNTDPANWMSIPRSLLPLLNSQWDSLRYDDADPDIKPYILLRAKLRQAAKRRKSELKPSPRKNREGGDQ